MSTTRSMHQHNMNATKSIKPTPIESTPHDSSGSIFIVDGQILRELYPHEMSPYGPQSKSTQVGPIEVIWACRKGSDARLWWIEDAGNTDKYEKVRVNCYNGKTISKRLNRVVQIKGVVEVEYVDIQDDNKRKTVVFCEHLRCSKQGGTPH